jgi:hypothetical protein
MEEDDQQRRGFRVTDRRRFADAGASRDADPSAAASATRAEDAPPAPAAAPAAEAPAAERPLPGEPLTFSTFVLGLSTQVLLHLGEIPDPQTHQVEADLGAAKQVIDVLGILADKTRNNLDAGEQALLESVLYDLRMRYVELVGQEAKERT